VKDDTNYYVLNGTGFLSGTTVTASGSGGAGNQSYPSAVTATSGGTACFNYANGDSSGGVYFSSGYKVVYFSFGFEAINSAATRTSVMSDVLGYLGGTTSPTHTPVATHTPAPTNTPVPPTATPTPPSSKSLLIVDDDKGKSYQTYYTDALPAGYTYTTYTVSTNGPAWSYMDDFDAVIWLTGDDWSTTLTTTDVTNLTTYLSNGGRLFISGQDIGYDIRTNSFYGSYLRASYVKDDTNNYDLSGVTGSVMAGISVNTQGSGGANNQSYPSGVNAASGGQAIFNYGGSGNGSGGVSYSGSYRCVYLSFGFEAIDTSADRSSVMNAALNFLTN